MSYKIDIQRKDGFLHAAVSGPNTRDAVQRYLMDVYQACLESGCPYVLVEENLSGRSLSMSEVNQIASTGSEGVWPVVQAIGYVDANPEHFPSRMDFAAAVATTRGLNVRSFANVADAEKWLRETIRAAADRK